MRTCLIEDEAHARENLEYLLENYVPEIQLVGVAKSVDEGVKIVLEKKPELVLLDIELPDGSGFDLLNRVPDEQFNTIFITAYEDYAIKAIKQGAFDYVLKPISVDEFRQSFNRLKEANAVETKTKTVNTLALPDQKTTRLVEVKDIICLLADRSYTKVHTVKEQLVVSKNLKSFETLLEKHDSYIRIHRSAIVNVSHIEEISKADGGALIMKNDVQISMPSRGKEQLVKKILKMRDSL